MGYTHYWRQKRDFTSREWSEICIEAGRLLGAVQARGIKLVYEFDEPKRAPVIDAEMIRFNGGGGDDMAHETFLLDRERPVQRPYESGDDYARDGSFTFCKTARKPYDLAVCAVLLAAMHHGGDAIAVSSDGEADDWQPARDLYTVVLGRAAPVLRDE